MRASVVDADTAARLLGFPPGLSTQAVKQRLDRAERPWRAHRRDDASRKALAHAIKRKQKAHRRALEAGRSPLDDLGVLEAIDGEFVALGECFAREPASEIALWLPRYMRSDPLGELILARLELDDEIVAAQQRERDERQREVNQRRQAALTQLADIKTTVAYEHMPAEAQRRFEQALGLDLPPAELHKWEATYDPEVLAGQRKESGGKRQRR